jgi:hypothetical protein
MALAFKWDGETMRPLRPKIADETFVIGQVHWLQEEQPRHMPAHRACFAHIRELWLTLPEHLAEEFPSPEALRARALIEAGYCTDRHVDAGSKAGAERIAAYVRGEKPFASVVTRGTIVVIREPESQSVKAMGAERFKESMKAVELVIAGLIGVAPETVQAEAGRAA